MKRNNQLKAKYALRKIICFSGRHIDKTMCLYFSSFSKKGLSDCCISGKGKRSILSCNKIIMRNLYNTNLMPTAKVLRNELKLFENETLE